MGRPLRHPREFPLTSSLLPGRTRLRLAAVTVGIVALAGLWRTATVARARILADADRSAARMAAGYLTVIASAGRADRSPPEMRLLSAAGNLAGARFWTGGIQVWLKGTPLLPGDTAGTGAEVAPFTVGDSAAPASVAVWRSAGDARGAPLVAVGGGAAVAALMVLAFGGALMAPGRPRAFVAGLGLLIVGVGVLGQGRGVYTTWRDAEEAGLLRARRILEITAVGRRLTDAEVDALGGGLVVTPIQGADLVRDSTVMRDTLGSSISAVAARGQAWRVAAPVGVERYTFYWRALLGWGVLALAAGFVAAALPPGARYLSASRPRPPTIP